MKKEIPFAIGAAAIMVAAFFAYEAISYQQRAVVPFVAPLTQAPAGTVPAATETAGNNGAPPASGNAVNATAISKGSSAGTNVYNDPNGAFSFSYPSSFDFGVANSAQSGSGVWVSIPDNYYPNTNLEGAGFGLLYEPADSASSCPAQGGTKGTKTINGTSWNFQGEQGGAAAGHYSDTKTYSAWQSGTCYQVALEVDTYSIADLDPSMQNQVSEINSATVFAKPQSIFSTLTLDTTKGAIPSAALPLPSVSITAPAVNVQWSEGNTYTITWSTGGVLPGEKATLSVLPENFGGTPSSIATGVPLVSGIYSWKVPAGFVNNNPSDSGQYQVYLQLEGGTSAASWGDLGSNDIVGGLFTILPVGK